MSVNKFKTKKAASKRFKKTATGKLMRHHANKSHILTKKTRKRKRRLAKGVEMDSANVKAMRTVLPYL